MPSTVLMLSLMPEKSEAPAAVTVKMPKTAAHPPSLQEALASLSAQEPMPDLQYLMQQLLGKDKDATPMDSQ